MPYIHEGRNDGFLDMIEDVAKVEPKAAKQLIKWYMIYLGIAKGETPECFGPYAELDGCFVWDSSPQKHSFWSRINAAIYLAKNP